MFHAGTSLSDGKVVTNGGRVLCAVGLGNTVSDAQKAAYALCDKISWNGVQYRRDIGYRAVQRELPRKSSAPLPAAVSSADCSHKRREKRSRAQRC